MSTDPRRTAAYQRARAEWLLYAGSTCHLCGGYVDVTLSGTLPHGPTVEHTVDVVVAPHLAMDRSLWRLAHRRCNSLKGASLGGRRLAARKRRTDPPRQSRPSRDW